MSEIKEVKDSTKRLIRLGYSQDQINSILISKHTKFKPVVLSDVVEDCINEYPDYGVIQKIMRSKLVFDITGDTNKVVLLDEETRSIDQFDISRIKYILDPKFDLRSRIYTCKYEYRPLDPGMLLKNSDGTHTYNTYVPPFWQEDWFYGKGEFNFPKTDKLPFIYEKFLTHLVGDSKDSKASYDYILKWLANGLKNRNYCVLATIGNQGIGKGVLGSIMKTLFGDSNYYEGNDRMFKGTFNSQIADRRIVYCDEITIKEREDEDRLKLVVNDFIEIEKKGIDAKNIRNYASFYISSNHMDAIKLSGDDRRFSIVQLTDKKLVPYMTPDEIRSLTSPENISQLAYYLWHLQVDEMEMSTVFKTQRTDAVRAGSLKEWEHWFIFDYCDSRKGETVLLQEVQEHLSIKLDHRAPGRPRFEELKRKYPEVFTLIMVKVEESNKEITKWAVRIN